MTPKSLLLSGTIPNTLIIVGNINQKILQKIFFKMQFDLEKIKKLPADVKKDFMKMALKLDEKKKISKVKDDFLSFANHMWPEFIEGRHHKITTNSDAVAEGARRDVLRVAAAARRDGAVQRQHAARVGRGGRRRVRREQRVERPLEARHAPLRVRAGLGSPGAGQSSSAVGAAAALQRQLNLAD